MLARQLAGRAAGGRCGPAWCNRSARGLCGRPAAGWLDAGRLKRLALEYGVLATGFHFGVWCSTMAGFYVSISAGLDVNGLAQYVTIEAVAAPGHEGLKTLAAAYAATVATGPARLALDLVAVPAVARRLRAKRKAEPPAG